MAVHPGSIWLMNNWSPNQLPDGKWIAASSTGLVEFADNLDDLYQIINRLGIPFDDVAIAFTCFGEIQ